MEATECGFGRMYTCLMYFLRNGKPVPLRPAASAVGAFFWIFQNVAALWRRQSIASAVTIHGCNNTQRHLAERLWRMIQQRRSQLCL